MMPSLKFIFTLSFIAIGLLILNVKPDLFRPTIQTFLSEVTRPSLACNSPDLFNEFHRLFDDNVTKARIKLERQRAEEPEIEERLAKRYEGRPELGSWVKPEIEKSRKTMELTETHLNHIILKLGNTQTLGQLGNQLSCRMDYSLAEGLDPANFEFLLGQDDQGHLTWQYDRGLIPPYELPLYQ